MNINNMTENQAQTKLNEIGDTDPSRHKME